MLEIKKGKIQHLKMSIAINYHLYIIKLPRIAGCKRLAN